MSSEGRRKDRGLGLQRGERQFTWKWKNKCLVNRRLLCHAETAGRREDFGLQALLSDPCRTQPVFFVDISGDGALPGSGPLSKFFRQ